jgi:hypothetical protein
MTTGLVELRLNALDTRDYDVIPNPAQPPIINFTDTMKRWRKITKHLIDGLSWKNFIIAGGSVWRCISDTVDDGGPTDLDFFVYGETAEDRAEAVLELLQHFSGNEFEIYGSVITINASRPVQIICSAAETAREVLSSFDMSHLQACFIKDRFMSMPDAEWSIRTNQTILITETTVERLHKAYAQGLSILYKPGLEFADQYGVMHPMPKYIPRSEAGITQKIPPQLTTRSIATALITVKLDGAFKSVIPYRTVKSPLDYQLLDFSKLSVKTLDLGATKVQVNFLKYNEKDLFFRTCPLKLNYKYNSGSGESNFAIVEIQKKSFRTFIDEIMTHYPITKVKTGRRGEVFGPFRDDYYQEQLNLGCDRDILVIPDNPEDYLKCSFKELPVQVGETFTGIVSLRFSDRSSERYWKLIIQDPTDLPVQPYHNTDDNEYSDTDEDGCIECIDTDEELDSVLGLS